MEFGPVDRPLSGLLLPLASLRGGGGIGEYPDLVALGRWARALGLDLLQVLPLQDTGEDPSPYAALSATALHPVYLRLEELPGADRHGEALDALRARHRDDPRVRYGEVLAAKLELLRAIATPQLEPEAAALEELAAVRPDLERYARFRARREAAGARPWWEWPEGLADPPVRERHFWLWVQRECENQLEGASRALDRMGIRLLGDVPILLQADSADVWDRPELFDRSGQAGAPPDMYTAHGQNWGFPVYDWPAHEAEGFRWWRQRMAHADRFYHAIRVDHVLGFFRIWRIPAGERSAALGQYDPALPVTGEQLSGAGFDPAQVEAFLRPGGAGAPPPPSEEQALAEPDPARREELLWRRWDRILLPHLREEGFRPAWWATRSAQFAALTPGQQESLRELLVQDEARQQPLWARTGRHRLKAITGKLSARVYPEDLGAVPACVPEVLDELGLPGLRLERDHRRADGSFEDPAGWPSNSLACPTTHDSSTLRGWWEGELDPTARAAYARAAGWEEAPDRLGPHHVEAMLRRNLAAGSHLVVLALQDLLAVEPSLRPDDPADERINVPGTPPEENWSWRMPVELEELPTDGAWGRKVRSLLSSRPSR